MTSPELSDLLSRWEQAYVHGQDLPVEQLCPGPELAAELARCIDDLRRMHAQTSELLATVLATPARSRNAAAQEPPTLALHADADSISDAGRTLRYVPAQEQGRWAGAAVSPPGYEVLGELGRGGMGVVYKARQVKLNRVVALKMVLSGGHAGEEERVRFLAEAEAIAAVEHPGIVQVHDFGTHDGLPFFSLELCPGGSLAAKLAGGPLQEREAAQTVERVARAVQAAHERGIIHRDLKPGNVLLAEDGSPKVTDFGLAKRVEGGSGLTQTGAVMGTPSYMAPEQAEGKKNIGPVTDVYALGAILYECLVGRPPFRAATSFDTLVQVVSEEPVAPRQLNARVPKDLETVCLKCLEKDPARRYSSAADLAEDLRRWQAGEPIAARPAGRLERGVKWARRRPLAAALLGVSVLAALGLAVLSLVAVAQWRRAVAALGREQDARLGERQARRQEEQERAQRALAQVDALLLADPRAVPAILDNLAKQRAEVLPRLRQVWDGPDTEPTRPLRMRAALALLPSEPNRVRGALVSWMLQVPDPAELLVVRDALRPHTAELRGELWRLLEQAKTPPAQRLRLLAALAAFDPQGAGWKTVGTQALEPWLADNPLYLGTWTEALRPSRDFLLGPLTDVLLGKQLGERRLVAANILADYAKDRPETLVDLLVQADDRQFATLLPVLQRQRQRVIPLLTGELQRRAVPPWNDRSLPPAWQTQAAELRREVEEADGLLAERFAFVQTLPLERFGALAESLRGSGYRPIRFRPYCIGPRLAVAGVWTRDGRDWRLLQGVSAERLRQQDAELRKHGYQPVDVCGWLQPGAPPAEVHAALWARVADRQETRLYVGIPQSRHDPDGWGPLKKAGLDPLTFHAFRGADGARRCNSVWARINPSPQGVARFWDDEPDHKRQLTPDRVQMDVGLSRAGPRPPPRQAALAEVQRRNAEMTADAKNLLARGLRGRAYAQLGEDRQALADLDAYLSVEKKYGAPFAERALVLARLGRAAAANKDLQAFRRLAGASSDVPLVAALVAVYLGQDADVWPRLDALARQEKANAAVLFKLAVVHAQAAQQQRLRDLAAVASAVGRADPLGIALLAGVQPQRGDRHRDRAVALLEQALAGSLEGWQDVETDPRLEPLHDHPGYRALLERFHLERDWSGVWHPAAGTESIELSGLAPSAHRERCRELAAQGYRPAALCVADTAPGKPLVTASVWQRPRVTEEAREKLARRQSGAGLALLRLGQAEPVWPLLKHHAYPEARTRLLHRLGPEGVPADLLAERLEVETDVSVRRALILALGEYRSEQVPAELRQRLVTKLLGWYRDDPDAGIHGAIDWLLRHGKEGKADRPLDWGQARALQQIDADLAAQLRAERVAAAAGRVGAAGGLPQPAGATVEPARQGRGWYVNGQSQTFTVLDARQPFLMGSPGDELGRHSNENLHWRQIGRRYAIATRPVTVAQWERFRKAHPEVKHSYLKVVSPVPDGPIISVTWFEAAQYCRWLSEQEGFPEHEMVYPRVAVIEKCKDGVTPLRLPANHLKRRGYRLPTEGEWEHACRAGARTTRYHGSGGDLLPRYAWYLANAQDRTWPVGQKKPNDFGLFDMHGNVRTWCQESRWGYPEGTAERPAGDKEDSRSITDRLFRSIRGSTFDNIPMYVRTSYRNSFRPTYRNITVGVRLARTCD
jgi:formylglycine-generating enzyme required for sulfatase activity/tRNA A-37 threonylcarbamoyl transferase component Bud32